ncbi:MAG: helix-turn-helix domain-containing protein [Candidatus Shapirobacteria bacterium]|nr:helix-turn-helix domain-containing protein [Candidatus Shapirobacteria bacterium]MDD4410743.1 helix-turn-helix domain-containing protein [Candidatus Shapirobacteria bacterium]
MLRTSSILKNTRLDKEYDLLDVSKKLKIPVKYLIAIEDEEVKCFPQEPYCSLIIKDYADYLGLNGQEMLSFFRRDFEQNKKNKSLKKENLSFTPQFTFSILIGLILVSFIFYLTSEYLKFNRPPKLKVNWPENIANNSFDLSGITDPDSTIRINQDLIIVDDKGNFQKKIQASSGGELKITVESKSPSGKTTVEEKVLKTN